MIKLKSDFCADGSSKVTTLLRSPVNKNSGDFI